MQTKQVISALMSLILAACEGGLPQTATYTARDSAGVEFVISHRESWRDDERWWLESQPVVDIGADVHEPAQELFMVRSVARFDDGRIVAVNGADEMRVFDAAGRHVTTLGGKGEGPGEFANLSWVQVLPGDSLLAYDTGQLRITLYDQNLTLVRTERLSPESGFPSVIARLADGSLLATIPVLVTGGIVEGPRRPPARYVKLAPSGEVLAEVVDLQGVESFVQINPGGGFSGANLPFARANYEAASPTHIFAGESDTFRILSFGIDGALERVILRDTPPRRVSEADVETVKREHLSQATESFRPILERMYLTIPFPEYMPAFSDMIADALGFLWVKEFAWPENSGNAWLAFNDRGVLLGSVALPERFTPVQIGETWILGTWRDELDVEHVQLYRLHRGATA